MPGELEGEGLAVSMAMPSSQAGYCQGGWTRPSKPGNSLRELAEAGGDAAIARRPQAWLMDESGQAGQGAKRSSDGGCRGNCAVDAFKAGVFPRLNQHDSCEASSSSQRLVSVWFEARPAEHRLAWIAVRIGCQA